MGAPLSRSREARLCAFPLHIADLGFTANVATYTTTSAMRLALMDFALCTSPEGQFQSDCSNLAVIGTLHRSHHFVALFTTSMQCKN
jgi:hypothetical protein